MQFLKTLFWVAVTVVLVLFSKANWRTVPIELWGGLEADIKLPVLVLGAFLLGLLPTLLLFRTRLWALRRRLETTERNVMASHATQETSVSVGAAASTSSHPATAGTVPPVQ